MLYFVVVSLFFVLLEKAFPAVRPKALFRRGFRTELFYLAMPPPTRAVSGVVVGLAVASAHHEVEARRTGVSFRMRR